MSNKSDDLIREWVRLLFSVIKEEYGHAPERLNMDVRLENGDELRVYRTPRHAGSGEIEVEFRKRKFRSI